MTRIVVAAAVVLIALTGFYLFAVLGFEGVFDTKYTREELTKNFLQREKKFADLETYFRTNTSRINGRTITFGCGQGGGVYLNLFPDVIDPANKIIGGDNLKLGSPELDSILSILGWTMETVTILKARLEKTKCDFVRTTDFADGQIQLYPYQNGWRSFTYSIVKTAISDSLIRIYGKPIGGSDFGKRVFLDYSSAL